MYKELIKQYIMNLSSKDITTIITYAQKKKIIITVEQAQQILSLVKENCQNLLDEIYQPSFSKLTNIVNIETANQIKKLYLENIKKIQ